MVIVVSNRNEMMIHEYDRKEGRKEVGNKQLCYTVGVFLLYNALVGEKKRKVPEPLLRNNTGGSF